MPRTAGQAAYACAALWIVHAVDCATWARRNLSGPRTVVSHGEPTPADAVETAVIYDYACALTERLHERADQLGLDPGEVEAGRVYAECRTWPQKQADYKLALCAVGGALAP